MVLTVDSAVNRLVMLAARCQARTGVYEQSFFSSPHRWRDALVEGRRAQRSFESLLLGLRRTEVGAWDEAAPAATIQQKQRAGRVV